MKIAKVLVLSLFMTVAGYAAVTGHISTASDDKKAAACNDGQSCCAQMACCQAGADCCKAGADCCKADADCCKAGAECCKAGAECCKAGAECCNSAMTCCSGDRRANQAHQGHSDKPAATADTKSCCSSACTVHAAAKK